MDDETAIRGVVEAWMVATRDHDAAAIRRLMTDDVVFLTPARAAFGGEAFLEAFVGMKGMSFEGRNEILELTIAADWAFLRSRIEIVVTPPGGSPKMRSGEALTIMRKGADGQWRLARDANLIA